MVTNRYLRKQRRYFKERVYDAQKDKNLLDARVRKAIDKAVKQGRSPSEISKVIQKEIRKSRNYAQTIARTEATRAENFARHDICEDIYAMGVMLIKIWNTQMDGRQRDSHRRMDKEEQFIDDEFSNGGMYPGDPNLPDGERYNCRCSITPRMLEEYKLKDEDRDSVFKKITELTNRMLNESNTATRNDENNEVNLRLLSVDSKQFNNNIKKYMADFGIDAKKPNARAELINIINDIVTNPDEIRHGMWRRQGKKTSTGRIEDGPVDFIIKGKDVVVIKNGKFITILKNGITNNRVVNASKRYAK